MHYYGEWKIQMDEISGSVDSLASLGTAMSEARVQNEMAISTLKKGMDVQARNALGLIASVPAPPPVNTPTTGQQIDLVA